MEGYVVVARRPDGTVGVYGSGEGIPFGSREAAVSVAADPAKHLESGWECTVHPLNGLPE
jgi:hypothetical protein